VTGVTGSAQPPDLEDLATRWLAAEDRTTAEPEYAQAGEDAVRLGAEYEEALASASPEERRLAWEAARTTQANTEVGSTAWAAARRVAELLRVEYLASRET
jgi:hypothetical protein